MTDRPTPAADRSSPTRRTDRTLAAALALDHEGLLVAGAAAAVWAVFNAPATGAVFSFEVPYRSDLACHQFLPALIAAVAADLAVGTVSVTDYQRDRSA